MDLDCVGGVIVNVILTAGIFLRFILVLRTIVISWWVGLVVGLTTCWWVVGCVVSRVVGCIGRCLVISGIAFSWVACGIGVIVVTVTFSLVVCYVGGGCIVASGGVVGSCIVVCIIACTVAVTCTVVVTRAIIVSIVASCAIALCTVTSLVVGLTTTHLDHILYQPHTYIPT